MVGIAQLVERRLVVADVAGSSPVTHPEGIEPLTCSDAVRGSIVPWPCPQFHPSWGAQPSLGAVAGLIAVAKAIATIRSVEPFATREQRTPPLRERDAVPGAVYVDDWLQQMMVRPKTDSMRDAGVLLLAQTVGGPDHVLVV